MNRCSRLTLLTPLVAVFCFLVSALASPAQTSGEITGQVQNGATGDFMNNARVSVAGTKVEAFTDAAGRYRLSNVAAGSAQIVVTYEGFHSQTATVQVAGGAPVEQNFELFLSGVDKSETVVLDKYTVSGRILSGQAQALNEQRNAANIKTVVAFDQFPDMGEGNVGEFLKHVPGIALNYNPQTPAEASIRGMPSSGTIVTMDGLSMASSGANGRAFDLNLASVGNVDRIEVTKVPTPDMPANAVGGGVNIISKSGFGRKTPLLSYNLFSTYTAIDGAEKPSSDSLRVARPDGRSNTSRIQPAFNLSYILPLNDSLAFTFALSKSTRYNDWQTLRPVWNKVTLVQSSQQHTHAPLEEDKFLASASMEWRVNPNNTFRFSVQRTKQEITLRQNSIISQTGAGATTSTASDGLTVTQGAATGVGSTLQGFGWNNQYKPLTLFTGTYKFQKGAWKFDLGGSYSKAGIALLDTDDNFFSNISNSITSLIVRHEGDTLSDGRRMAALSATTRTGTPVDIFDAANYTINSATASNRRIHDEVSRAEWSLSRVFDGSAMTATVKIGGAIDRRVVDDTSATQSFTFTPPGGATAKLASNHDVVDENFSAGSYFTDAYGAGVRFRFISPTKLYKLYQANPSWFVLNESAAHIAKVNATKELVETVTAAYVRGDLKLMNNRLWIVGGVRFEKTNDDGRGPLNNIGNTYVKDANGNIVLSSGGAPVRITTNALELAQLQYTLLGSAVEKSYQGYYPSLNVTYSISEKLLIRAAYAKTIGRPNFTDVIPSIIATDPTAAEASRTVTVINSGLKPWTADNFDLSLEAYGIKGAVAAISLFRKDITDFFSTTRTDATPQLLAEFGLSDDFLSYDIITKRNSGNAKLDGAELSYRQSFDKIHPWVRGLEIYGNLTYMDLGGPNEADFVNFVPLTINYGVSYTRSRFRGDVSVSQFSERRIQPAAANASTEADSYFYNPSQTKIDLSLEYRFSRKLSVYGTARNLFAKPLRRGVYNDNTPSYAKVDQFQFTGAMFTLGIKGTF